MTLNDMETYEQGKQDGRIIQELKDINSKLAAIGGDLKGQEQRIRTLENWKWWLLGASAAIGVGAAKLTHAAMSTFK